MTWWWVSAFIGVFVLLDALRRTKGQGWSFLGWAVGTLLLCPIIAPIYFAKRPLKPGEVREGGTAWNILKNFALTWTILMAIVTVVSLSSMSEHVSTLRSDAERAGAAVGTMLGLGMFGAIWFFPMFGALVLGFFLKQSSVVEKG